MKYRNLGSSGVKVSSLCLGAMTFGEADEKSFMHKAGSDEATSHAVLDRAVAAGINFVDTADVYGQDGLSERVLGNWIAARGTRDKIVLATKFRFTMGDGPNRSGASRYRIMKCVDDSLRRLRTDRIDLYQIHMQDITVPEDETLRALDDLVRAGKVLYIGCSNYAAYRLMRSLWLSRTHHVGGVRHAPGPVQPAGARPRARARPAVPRRGPRHPAVVAARRRLPHRQVRARQAARRRGTRLGEQGRAVRALRPRAQLEDPRRRARRGAARPARARRRSASRGCSPGRRSPP